MPTLNPQNVFRKLFPTSRRLLVDNDIKKYCKNNKYDSVLVIGAGHDPYRKYFFNTETYIALDIVDTPGVTDIVADATELPFGDNKFDCVLAFEVMEHVEFPEKLISEAHRVLAKDGDLLLSVPFMFHNHGDPFDYWRPTRNTLKNILNIFSEFKIQAQGNRIHVISDLVTTSFHPRSVLLIFRIINHVFVNLFSLIYFFKDNHSSAPSGHMVVAKK
jgi:SAM-dependent methyltransferase